MKVLTRKTIIPIVLLLLILLPPFYKWLVHLYYPRTYVIPLTFFMTCFLGIVHFLLWRKRRHLITVPIWMLISVVLLSTSATLYAEPYSINLAYAYREEFVEALGIDLKIEEEFIRTEGGFKLWERHHIKTTYIVEDVEKLEAGLREKLGEDWWNIVPYDNFTRFSCRVIHEISPGGSISVHSGDFLDLTENNRLVVTLYYREDSSCPIRWAPRAIG